MIIFLDNDRQVSVTSGQEVRLKVFACGGSLGVSMTIKEATDLWRALCTVITESIAKEG